MNYEEISFELGFDLLSLGFSTFIFKLLNINNVMIPAVPSILLKNRLT